MKQILISVLFLCAIHASMSQDYKFGKISKAELEQNTHPKYPESDAAILYREVAAKIDYSKEHGYVLYTEVHERIKIYSQEGYEWATGAIDLRRSNKKSNRDHLVTLKGYTYLLQGGKVKEVKLKNDGIFEEELTKYTLRTKFTMPALEEGCIIEYKYKIRSPFLGNIEAYKFQEFIPVDNVKFRFEAPEYFNYEQHQRGWIPFSIEKETANRTITEHYTTANNARLGGISNSSGVSQTDYRANISNLNLVDIPPLIEEAYSGNIENYASSILFELTYIRHPSGRIDDFSSTWESVCETIYKDSDFGDQLAKSNYFEDDLRQVTSGVSSDVDKMYRIYEFLKNKMTWNKYVGIFSESNVNKAYEEGIGNTADINLTLTAMFRKIGLNANPVLISTKSHGIPILPTHSGFNYVVAGVETSQGVLLFDACNKDGQADVLEDYLLNWQGRIVREDGTSNWVALQSDTQASEAFMGDLMLSSDGLITGTMKSQSTGYFAMQNRKEYSGLNEKDRDLKFSESIENVEITDLEFSNLTNPYEPLKIDYTFKTDVYSENIDENLYITPLTFLATKENPFNKEERKFPIDFGTPKKFRYIVNIAIPDGYKVTSLPESANLQMGDNKLAFKYLVSERNGKISIMGEFRINAHFMGPEDYSDVKEFYQFFVEKEKEKIVLSKL